ncbi:MAG: helix-turn-helix domain-containing protein, partial [Actinomadura rubrobrunea]|nr:helix-turn-helix domain-containing protein [Actinomadura rubrobrunea]
MTPDELHGRNFLSVRETAEFFASDQPCDERTVRRAIEQGQIPAVKIGAKTLVPVAPLLALVEAPATVTADARTDAVSPTAEAISAVREILCGALRALDALTGHQGQDHDTSSETATPGHDTAAGEPDIP